MKMLIILTVLFSITISFVTDFYADETQVNAPTNLIATGNWGKNVIVFNNNSSIGAGFQLYTSIDDTLNWNLLVTLSSSENSFIHTGLNDNVVYYYKVRAIDVAGNYSGFSNIDFVVPLAPLDGEEIYTTVGDYIVDNADSIKYYIENATAGDTILIRGGTYYQVGRWDWGNSGTAGNPIVLKGYGQEEVIIDQSQASMEGLFWANASISRKQKHYLRVENITWKNASTISMWVAGDYAQIKYNKFYNTGGSAIGQFTGNHSYFAYNEFYNSGWNDISFESRSGYGLRSDSSLVEFNYFKDNTSHFFLNGFPKEQAGASVLNDDFYLTGHVWRYNISKGSNGIYLRYFKNLEVYGNLFLDLNEHGIRFATGGAVQPPLPFSANIKVYNNVFTMNQLNPTNNPARVGFQNPTGTGNIFINNIIYGFREQSSDTPMYIAYPSLTLDNISNNGFYNPQGDQRIFKWGSYLGATTVPELNQLSNSSGNIWADPLFDDKANDVMTLRAGSPYLDAGLNLGSPYDYSITETQFPFSTYELIQRTGTWDIGAYENFTGPDITPPEVTGAVLLDSIKLVINFTEALEESGAENTNNYSITPNVDVFDASLSGNNVTLTTDIHTPGLYTVTVNNVKDLAGNTILPSANSADYEWEDDSLHLFTQLTIVEATASSVPEPEHSPDKTIDGEGFYDGDPDSRWAAEPMPEWIMFDLGDAYSVSMTKLSFYRWNEGRIYNYSILGSTDASNWQDILTNVNSSSEEWTIEEFDPIEVRYIRVVHNSSNQNDWAGLWEGQIWGFSPTNVKDETQPEGFKLEQNYPNPFNPSTKIKFTVPEKENVVLKVFNSLGQEVAELVNSEMENGVYEIDFNASGLASGVYIYRIIAGNFIDTKKMILLH